MAGRRTDVHVDNRSLKDAETYGPPFVVVDDAGRNERGHRVCFEGPVELVSDESGRAWLITLNGVTVHQEQPQAPKPLPWK